MLYRITRPTCYPPGTPGHKDLSARQGYYADAANPKLAVTIQRKRWDALDMLNVAREPLDVQEWADRPHHGIESPTVIYHAEETD